MLQKQYVLLTFILFLLGCQSQQTTTELFGQNLEPYVTTKDINEEDLKGFLAQPKTSGNYPGIIMIHEWWGLNDNIKEMAKLVAKEGYVVFAVDLYGEVATTQEKARELSGKVRSNPAPALEAMKNAVQYLKENHAVPKVASLGWCFGGGQSLQLSLNEKLDTTVIYYGNLVNDTEQLKNIQWPVLGIFGEEDTSIPPSAVQSFEAALNELNIKNEIYIYPGAGHAFANPTGNNYAKEETQDAWRKTLEFLQKHLKSE